MRNLLLSALVLAFTVPVAGSWVGGASDPARAAQDADHIIHGTIIGVEQCSSGAPSFQGTDVFHPVHLAVENVFVGNSTDTVITMDMAGSETAGVRVSTAASFSEGEEVVVMLQEHEDHLYLNSGANARYPVNSSGIIRLREPEDHNITLTEMAGIIHNATNATGPAPSAVERNAINPSTIEAPSHCGLWDTIRGFLMQLF